MMNKKIYIYAIFWLLCGVFCTAGLIFANVEVNTSLSILPPPYSVIYYPPHITGTYLSGPVYVEITWAGIRPNMSTGFFHNGTYSFDFRRGTGLFTTWAAYSSGNLRSRMTTTNTIDRIDNTAPTFAWVAEGMTYATPVTITFSDTSPGVTATLNGVSFINWTTVSANGIYEFIVTDAAGNTTWAVFTIAISELPSWWGGGGWGTIPIKDNCPNGDYSPSYYDNTCALHLWYGAPLSWIQAGTRELIIQMCTQRNCNNDYYTKICGPCSPTTTGDFSWNINYSAPTQPSIFESPFPKEWNDVYLRAYGLGITTVPNIQDADLKWVLYRKFAAKMVSEFAINVIGLVPDTTRTCEFKDIKKEIPELQYYIKLSCQLGIMGLDYYWDEVAIFNPNHVVTRDQFVTILSRAIRWDTYNLQSEEYSFYDKVKNFVVHTATSISNALGLNIKINTPLDWYTKHLEAIKKLWLMTDYAPSLREFRIYVMIMMYKIDNMWIENVQKFGK